MVITAELGIRFDKDAGSSSWVVHQTIIPIIDVEPGEGTRKLNTD